MVPLCFCVLWYYKFGFIEEIQDTEIQDIETAVAVWFFHILYLVTCISPINCNLPFHFFCCLHQISITMP